MNRMQPLASRQRGWTLIEIMMVVLIIGILVAVVAPNFVGAGDKARWNAERANLRSVAQALEIYRMDNRRYPTTDQGLEALVSKPSGYPEARNWGPDPYLRKRPVDQWENEYVYVSDGRTFELKSLGADATEGGEGFDADIAYGDN